MDAAEPSPNRILKAFLVPYALLFTLFLVVIGGGGSWLYWTAREVQTGLFTNHILEVVGPTVRQIVANHNNNTKQKTPPKLSNKVTHLYRILPHLRQISVRSHRIGYGVRLASNKELVDVELEPLPSNYSVQASQQPLIQQLLYGDEPFFHITLDYSTEKNEPVQVDIAFDRTKLIEQIEGSMESLVHKIGIFSALSFFSLFLALILSVYIGKKSHQMGVQLQFVYYQATMGKLAAELVHDFRNLLTSIRANIKNLLITPEETDDIVVELDQDIINLEGKLNDFLQLTRPRKDEFTWVDLNSFVTKILKRCDALFQEKHQTLILDIPPDSVKISVMAESFSSALINLLVNAQNHTPENGRIWFRVKIRTTQIEITVENEGAEIAEEVLPHVFDPFFTTRSEGHGLGLAIVKRIVTAHKGTVTVQNRSEGGAKFTIILPLNKKDE